jgi:hypothetical protein
MGLLILHRPVHMQTALAEYKGRKDRKIPGHNSRAVHCLITAWPPENNSKWAPLVSAA